MTRLALLSCALLVACGGGSSQPPDTVYDFAGVDLHGKPTDDAGPLDLGSVDLSGPKADLNGVADMTTPPDMTNSLAPVVVLTSPTASVKSDNLVVVVSVTSPTGRTITGVTMLVGSSTTPVTLSQVTSGVWQGSTDVTAVPSGTVPLVVSATDDTPLTGKLTTTFVLDHGPNIVFIQPTAMTAKNTIAVQATITDPLGKAILPSNVTVGVHSTNDVTVMVTNTTASSITISGTITFNDPQYSPALTGNQVITIKATNMDGATASAQKTFTIDQTGPVISIQSPAENTFAGGLITVKATIDDAGMLSGVNAGSVYAEFASSPSFRVMLSPVSAGSDVYTALFDLSALGTTDFSYPTVSVTADDSLGNETTLSQSFYLDNSPPILSLGSPSIRVQRPTDSVCSNLFNPLGDDVVKDGTNGVLQAITLRARIEDQANEISGQTVLHPSGINASTVRLIVTPAPTAGGATPVLVVNDNSVADTSVPKKNLCNAINPLLTPVTSGTVGVGQYLSLPMGPLTSPGLPNYVSDTVDPVPAPCSRVGDPGTTQPPAVFSGSSDLSYTLTYLNTPTPAIWSLPTITTAPDPQAVGQQFDDGNIPEGWACFAAIAMDNIGNKAVSPPLRACIRRTSMANHPCDMQSEPDCRGTYTPASGSTPGATTSTACNAVNFDAGEIRVLPH